MELREIDVETYAKDVLPKTIALWGGGRDFERYASDTARLAGMPYGRKYYRTLAIYDGDVLGASCKGYERTVRDGKHKMCAFGIGAVFTPEDLRGRGYASAMLGAVLDRARRDGFSAAFLFSDIHPEFYKTLGFVELPSRAMSIRADSLDGRRIDITSLADADWTGVRRCFDSLDATREWGFERSPLVWDWIRERMTRIARQAPGESVRLITRCGRSVAYAFGRREPAHDALVLEEYGFADDAARENVPSLLRSAAGDLRRIIGWLPPTGAREVLPRGSVSRRTDGIFMMAPLDASGRALVARAARIIPSDGVWTADHI
ncbi:MAG: GNAT family N-acetyltransferase [Candidatus Eremiobacteraeota bacterium]|nr:GNAT family N-acetyltransferase [Candidatus Eremiobacteraeota bacterium]